MRGSCRATTKQGGRPEFLGIHVKKRWTDYLVLVFSGIGACVMGSEEKIIFTKDLGDGFCIAAVQSVEEGKVVNKTSAEEKALAEDFRKTYGLPRDAVVRMGPSYIGGRQLCSFRLLGKGLPKDGKVLLDVVTDYFAGFDAASKPEDSIDGSGLDVFRYEDYKVYDVFVGQSKVFILMHNLGEMHLESATLDKAFAVMGGWSEATLLGRGWERRQGGYLPIESGHIIPAKDRVYAFFVSNSGKCMLWEVRGKKATMVWESGVLPGMKQAEQKPGGKGNDVEESIGDMIEREEREKRLPKK